VKRRAWVMIVALWSLGCGAGKTKAAAPRVSAPASPQAAAKMISGAEFAKSASGRDRAIALMREAIAASCVSDSRALLLGSIVAIATEIATTSCIPLTEVCPALMSQGLSENLPFVSQ